MYLMKIIPRIILQIENKIRILCQDDFGMINLYTFLLQSFLYLVSNLNYQKSMKRFILCINYHLDLF